MVFFQMRVLTCSFPHAGSIAYTHYCTCMVYLPTSMAQVDFQYKYIYIYMSFKCTYKRIPSMLNGLENDEHMNYQKTNNG